MARTVEKDFGTPRSGAAESVTLQIDGKTVSVPQGTSVMHAAEEAGISIPRLCATDRLDPFGSCRLCVVEVEGRRNFPGSCHTEAADGMKVRTQSGKLSKLRANVMELYLSDLPADCAACASGACEMAQMARELGVKGVRYGRDGRNHQSLPCDDSNPYFTFDPAQCIVCSRCVRACDEIQGTFALTVQGRGFDSLIAAGQDDGFLKSDCVSCGACVQACPTGALLEKTVVESGPGDRDVLTTCAYCGVGCSFRAEVKGNQIVRMIPCKEGKSNEGHSCVKGRFAWTYATHPDRVTTPMIRKKTSDPWREATWEEALAHAASEFRRIQQEHGRNAIGGIASARCTIEETFLVQKLVRACFGNNNIDNCARVCHSPTGYGLKMTLGTSAGTQDFASVDHADVIMVVGANPTDAHPVFAARLKRRLRQGAKLIVVDPRRTELVRSPHVEAAYHLALKPGTNVAVLDAMAHVIVTGGLADDEFIRARCDADGFALWKEFISLPQNSPEALEASSGVPAAQVRAAARLYAGARNAAIYYGLGVSEHSQGSVGVMCLANLAMATGNLGRAGVGVNPLRGQNNVQGSCDMGCFPHELPGYRHVSDGAARAVYEREWGVTLDAEPGLRIPNMIDAAVMGHFKGLYIQGEDLAQSDPNIQHETAGLGAMECVVVHDLFLNETSKYAHVFLPGSSFLEKDGCFINAERRINRIRKIIEPLGGKADWEATMALAQAMGYDMRYNHASEILDEIARTTPTFSGVSYEKLDRLGSVQWPCNDAAPEGTPVMHVDRIVRNPGMFTLTAYVQTDEKTTPKFPLLLTTGRILSQYNVGTQTARTANNIWHDEDVLEIHAHDAEQRGIKDGDVVSLQSRKGETTLRAVISERMQPGVVYTTFHFAATGANVVTTEYSDWATECPEYKVTAVQVRLTNRQSAWQEAYRKPHD